jgi:K+-sensing histidine kinase KdpD
MTSNYPFLTLVNGHVTFCDGKFLPLPSEFNKQKNQVLIKQFYQTLLKKDHDDIVMGTDILGFDFVIFQGICNVGLLIGLSSSHLVNSNKKKYPSYRFDKSYIINRIKEDKKLQNFEEYIPIQIVTQNVHEIRNINAKITSSVDELLDYENDNEWEVKFDKADDNVKKIYVGSRLIKFILDNFKFYMPNYLESLKPNTDRNIYIHKSVNKVVKIFSNHFKKRKTIIDFEGNTFRQMQGDKELFEIMLMLLIENAVKYSVDAHSICPKVKICEAPKNIVQIIIQSYGTLIPIEDEPKLFTRGFRSKAHKTKDGTGMGLYNANAIVKLLGGELVYSKNNLNSSDFANGWNCFTVTLRNTTI